MSTVIPLRVLAGVLLLTFSGCSCSTGPTTMTQAGNPDVSFVIVRLKYPDRMNDVALRADYGYIIDWPDGDRPVFYVFDKHRRTRVRAETWDSFVTALHEIPNGSEIDEVCRCTVPFAWGMPDEKRQELHGIFAQKALKLISYDDPAEHTYFCSCETTDVAILAEPAH